MNILIFGGSGFIGKKVVNLLKNQNYTLITPSSREINFTRPNDLNPEKLTALLQATDIIINMVGIMHNDKALMENVHHQSPAKIAQIAKHQGVEKWINLSALGADEHSNIAFVGSKGRGDKAILDLSDSQFTVKIARPSLVFGRGGASTEMFLKLANLPIIPLPNAGNFAIQPVHVDDVAQGLVNLALNDDDLPNVINFTGENVLTLAEYLCDLRLNILHKNEPKIVSVPMVLAKFSANILSNISNMVSSDSLTLLENGNTADNGNFCRLLENRSFVKINH